MPGPQTRSRNTSPEVGPLPGEATSGPPLPPRMVEALARLRREPIPEHDKALSGLRGLPLGAVGSMGLNLTGGEVSLPLLTLEWEPMLSNLRRMQSYCDARGALLAPHGKTTMSPQVWAEQLRAGAWAITVATAHQLEVAVAFGVPRVLIANEITTRHDLEVLASVLTSSDCEVFLFVDSVAGVDLLAEKLGRADLRPLNILIELGLEGGRCGVRDYGELDAVLQRVVGAGNSMSLVGVSGFEGIVDLSNETEAHRQVDELVDRLIAAGESLKHGSTEEPPLVSAGGSVFFDRIVRRFGDRDDLRLILRSGGYVTFDDGYLDGAWQRGQPWGTHTLDSALVLWGQVLSRPEQGRAILGFGRRDAPYDAGLPVVKRFISREGKTDMSPDGFEVTRLNDQHAFLDVRSDSSLEPGDIGLRNLSSMLRF